jgi:hypothetical protein
MTPFEKMLQRPLDDRYYSSIASPVKQFLEMGDERLLAKIENAAAKHYGAPYMLERVWPLLPPVSGLTELQHRALRAGGALGSHRHLAEWLKRSVEREPEREAETLEVYLAALDGRTRGRPRAALAIVETEPPLQPAKGHGPGAIEQFLLSLSDDEVRAAITEGREVFPLLEVFLVHAPQRVPSLVREFLVRQSKYGPYIDTHVCTLLLEHAPDLRSSKMQRNSGTNGARGSSWFA